MVASAAPAGARRSDEEARYSEEQIAYCLRQAESGMPVADVCQQMGIAEATYYIWKKKYASLGVSERNDASSLVIDVQEASNTYLRRSSYWYSFSQ